MTDAECYICGNGHPDILEEHHIVPRRFGGTDEDVNLVDLCPNCHAAVEQMYDGRFYEALGVEKPEPDTEEHECYHGGCASTDTERLEYEGVMLYACPYHQRCHIGPDHCNGDKLPFNTIDSDEITFYCEHHARCDEGRDCHATAIGVYERRKSRRSSPNHKKMVKFCPKHDPREQGTGA